MALSRVQTLVGMTVAFKPVIEVQGEREMKEVTDGFVELIGIIMTLISIAISLAMLGQVMS